MAFPNAEQRQVIEHRGAPLVVLGGPGTGKTAALTQRMIKLLRDDPERYVVFITFTRFSRKDTAIKVEKAVGEAGKEYAEIPRISTLHRFCKALVHSHPAVFDLDRFFPVPIKRQHEEQLILSEAMAEIGLRGDVDELGRLVVQQRATLETACSDNFSENDVLLANNRFEELLHFYGSLDMEGVVRAATQLISNSPDRLPPMFLQIDEFQDLNANDQAFVDALIASQRHEVVIVGDDTQSIYGFRNAFPEGIRTRFDSPEWSPVRLEECHRLPPGVLRAANGLVAGRGYYGAQMQIPQQGELIPTFQCTSTTIEKDLVANLVHTYIANETGRNGDRLEFSDFMILCPTRTIADGFARTLEEQHGIPARVIKTREMPEDMWRLVLLLRMIRSDDNLALRQWLGILEVDGSAIQTLRHDAERQSISLFQICRQSTNESIREVLRALGRLRVHRRNLLLVLNELRQFPALDVPDEVLWEVGFTEEPDPDAKLSANACIQKVYEDYGVFDVEDNEPPENAVSVATLHSAKGLEAEVVFLVRLEDIFLPMRGRDEEEQRRLLYVGMTRAKSKLILTFPERFDNTNQRRLRDEAMSPFLNEIREYLSIQRIMRRHISAFSAASGGNSC